MTENVHARAREWMLDDAMGALTTEQSVWLSRHLLECTECRKQQESLTWTVELFKSGSVSAPPFLAARTRAGLRSHASLLRRSREKRLMITLALCFDVVWTTLIVSIAVGTAPWFGFAGGMSWLVAGVIAWLWLLPALGMLVFAGMRKSGLAPALASWRELSLEGDARD